MPKVHKIKVNTAPSKVTTKVKKADLKKVMDEKADTDGCVFC